LLRKASETTAHVAGFGMKSAGCDPPNLSGFFRQLGGFQSVLLHALPPDQDGGDIVYVGAVGPVTISPSQA
jgi:hypothetical protein